MARKTRAAAAPVKASPRTGPLTIVAKGPRPAPAAAGANAAKSALVAAIQPAPPRPAVSRPTADGETQAAIQEVLRVVDAVSAGRLDVRGDADAFPGQAGELVRTVNRMVDAMVSPLRLASRAIDQIAHGRIPDFIVEEFPGEFHDIKQNVNTFLATMYGMHHEMQNLATSIAAGKLNTRGNDWDFEGNWRDLIDGVNMAIDAFVGPFRTAATYVDRISDGDIPEPLVTKYRGDFNDIRRNLNRLIATLRDFTQEMTAMSAAHGAGEIDAVIPEGRFDGAYRTMASGVNRGTRLHIDVLLQVLDILTSYAEGDFTPVLAQLPGKQAIANEKLDLLRTNLHSVVAELADLANAAVEGRLDRRVDDGRFKGDWQRMGRGVNETLDAVINPITEAKTVLGQLSNYDLTARMRGNYQGDHAQMMEAINGTASALHDAIAQVADSVSRVSETGARIAEISQAVAAGAAEQACSIEETSASLEEIGEGSLHNAESAEQATVITRRAKDEAEAGSSAAGRMIEAMREIRTSATDSLTIVQEIDGIAQKTDELATSAAVQAAHVGEASRGFAVVANAVRDLAVRSHEAAQRIEDMGRNTFASSGEAAASGDLLNIVGEINRIASQTNVLAVNASIEAAHVESAGMGLGLVTDQVRDLAARAKNAALRTGSLLQTSARLSQDGTAMSDDIDQQLRALVQAVAEVNGLVEQVAAASGDQRRGVEAVTQAMTSINGVTQRNVEGARESSNASEVLAEGAQTLQALVARFKIEQTARPTA